MSYPSYNHPESGHGKCWINHEVHEAREAKLFRLTKSRSTVPKQKVNHGGGDNLQQELEKGE
jgi:hypothetical protein